MHRIDTKTAQKDKFGAGKNGFSITRLMCARGI